MERQNNWPPFRKAVFFAFIAGICRLFVWFFATPAGYVFLLIFAFFIAWLFLDYYLLREVAPNP